MEDLKEVRLTKRRWWTKHELVSLYRLRCIEATPIVTIAEMFGRTPNAVQDQLGKRGWRLREADMQAAHRAAGARRRARREEAERLRP